VISDFRIDVPEAALVNLSDRIRSTRWPDAIDAPDWSYGTDRTYLQKLTRYWADGFDWREREQQLNSFPQFHIELDDLRIHTFHVRSNRSDAIPLLICHGWPGGNTEFINLLQPLANPENTRLPAFHVVAPAMPGYGFSDKPRSAGMNVGRIAGLWIRLMSALGYVRFAVQGGDWGSWVAISVCRQAPERVIAMHLNYVSARFAPPPGSDGSAITDEERTYLERRERWSAEEFGYGAIAGTKPQSLAYALNDSPVGLAAWIVEKFHGWSDRRGGSEPLIPRDEILTNIAVYWFTNSIGSSMRLYKEDELELVRKPPVTEPITLPVTVAWFPREIPFPPRSHLQKYFNIVRWTEMPAGGHFAALEQPTLLVDDIRAALS
jgi:pimeloyl-ACP methyl ester carboxylesterase